MSLLEQLDKNIAASGGLIVKAARDKSGLKTR